MYTLKDRTFGEVYYSDTYTGLVEQVGSVLGNDHLASLMRMYQNRSFAQINEILCANNYDVELALDTTP